MRRLALQHYLLRRARARRTGAWFRIILVADVEKFHRSQQKTQPPADHARPRQDTRGFWSFSPVVVALHLVVEDLALLRSGVGDQFRLDDLEDVVADVGQFRLDLGLVVADQGQLVALQGSERARTIRNKKERAIEVQGG